MSVQIYSLLDQTEGCNKWSHFVRLPPTALGCHKRRKRLSFCKIWNNPTLPLFFIRTPYMELYDKCMDRFQIFFFKAQVSFPSNFAPIFNAIKHNSSVLFCSNIIYFGQQMSILKQQVNSLSDFHHSSVSLHITPL